MLNYKDIEGIHRLPLYKSNVKCAQCGRLMHYKKDNGICLDCDTGVLTMKRVTSKHASRQRQL